MRILFLLIISLPFFFSEVQQRNESRSQDKNHEVNEVKTNKEEYIFNLEEKNVLITGIKLWTDLIASKPPEITQSLTLYLDKIIETYPKKGPQDGVLAIKKTKWGNIYLSLNYNKNAGSISISEKASKIALTNFNQDDFTKELELQLIEKNKKKYNYCYKHKENGTCLSFSSSIYYEYKYLSLKYPKLFITFVMEDDIEKYNAPGMYPKNFTSIIIETKNN